MKKEWQKIRKIIYNFLPLILLLVPSNAFANDSVTYNIAARMIDATERFTLTLLYAIADAYKPLYVSIATIGLIIILTKYLLTRVAPLREMISFFIALTLSSAIAFDANLFKEVVYDTFFDTLYRFDQFVVQSAASNMSSSSVSFDSLSGMFKTIDMSLMEISNFASEVSEDNKSWVTGFSVWLEAWIIYFLYLFVSTYFLIIFTVSIFGAHMMMILMPITISLYPFKRFRHYAGNCVNGMLHYGLVTVFACVAISLVVFIANDLVVEVARLKEEANSTGHELDIPADFLTASIMIGFLSIFIIKISTEFASRVLNSATSQLGGAFPMVVAGATTLARSSAMGAKVVAPAAMRAASYGAKGAGVVASHGVRASKYVASEARSLRSDWQKLKSGDF